ncbi:MAG: MMPL family transporter [Candidatus Thiodiazotropha sp.]
MKSTDQLALKLADFVTAHRWWVVIAALLLTGLTASGVTQLTFANNYRVFFSEENPDLLNFNSFQQTYSKNDNILLVLHPKEGEVFTPELAEAMERMTREAWQVPFVSRVDSISNFQHSWAEGDDLTVGDLIRGGASLSPETLAAKRNTALAEPLLYGQLVARDARTAGVNITLHFPEKSLTELPEAIAAAQAIADGIEADYPDVTVALTGIAALNNAFSAAGQSDAITLIPAMYGVLLLVMVFTLRNVSGTAATLMVILLSTLTAMGITGHLGISLDPISLTAAIVILTLAIADSIHFLLTLRVLMQEGMEKRAAIRESLRINFLAITVTSATTIVGFLTLNFSDAPPFKHLGSITAMGIAAAWLYSVTFLPAATTLLPFRIQREADGHSGVTNVMVRLSRLVTGNHRAVLVVGVAAVVTLVAMVPRLTLDDQWVEYFDERIPFRGDAEFSMEKLTGLYLIEYSVPSAEAGGISDPTYLSHLEQFAQWLRTQPGVAHVYSYSDIVKRLNKNMHGDEENWYALPEERDLAAQYLLLYELSLPYGLDLNDRITIDKSATRLTVTLDKVSTAGVRRFVDATREWAEANLPPHMWHEPTGATVMFSHISQRNIESMLGGNAIAVVLIALILVLTLRSLSLGALSLIPNVVPILMTFGAWALISGQVGMAAATVSATSLGIIVDNTVHFLTKYLRARREHGDDRPAAIEYAFRTVGGALVANAVILMIGFGVLAASAFRVNVEMGQLTAMAIFIALIVDLLLLPALLMIGHKIQPETLDDEHAIEAA